MAALRLILFLVLFIGLTAGGIVWAVSSSGIGREELDRVGELGAGTIAALAALSVGVVGTDVLRYRAIGVAVGTRVGWRAALETSVSNSFFSWVTPGAALGAPAAIYALTRRGIPLDAAVLISFGKSMTGAALLLAAAFFVLAVGLGPPAAPELTALLIWGSGIVAIFLVVPVVAAFTPEGSLRRIEGIRRRATPADGEPGFIRRGIIKMCDALADATKRLAALRARGVRGGVVVLGAHLLYFATFTGVAAVLAMAFGADGVIRAEGVSIVYLAFTYVAPTPGAAGLSEATAGPFFGDLVGPANAVLVVVLFRGLTLHLQILWGLVFVLTAGGLGQIMMRRGDQGTESPERKRETPDDDER